MKTINRNQVVAEELIRNHVRTRIQKRMVVQETQERKLRQAIRKLLEAATGTEEPSTYTGINVLADILEKIIPIIEDDYKMLTTSEEQRESFRNHIIHATKNALNPIEAAGEAEKLPESFVFELDKGLLIEKMKIDLDSKNDMEDPETIEGEFIDIDTEQEEDFVQIDDQNETGRNFAAATFKKIENQIVDAYEILSDEEDQTLFYDYLLKNLDLYFDKFEADMQPMPNVPEIIPDQEAKMTDEEPAPGGEEVEAEEEFSLEDL